RRADRPLLRQRFDHRRRSPPAVRRHQGYGERPPRRRHAGARHLLGVEGRLRRLLRQAATRADRHHHQWNRVKAVASGQWSVARAEGISYYAVLPIFWPLTTGHWPLITGDIMIVGLPKEVKDNEYRVGLVPAGVKGLKDAGHQVLVQQGAGEGSGILDEEFVR